MDIRGYIHGYVYGYGNMIRMDIFMVMVMDMDINKRATHILIRRRQCGQVLGGLCMSLSRDVFTVTFVDDENQASMSLAMSLRRGSALGATAWATVEFQSMRIIVLLPLHSNVECPEREPSFNNILDWHIVVDASQARASLSWCQLGWHHQSP